MLPVDSTEAEAVILDVAALNGASGALSVPARPSQPPPSRHRLKGEISQLHACAICHAKVDGMPEHPGCVGQVWEPLVYRPRLVVTTDASLGNRTTAVAG